MTSMLKIALALVAQTFYELLFFVFCDIFTDETIFWDMLF